MITQPTVFVIGAGGSAPYGFPTSIPLVDEIRNSTQLPQVAGVVQGNPLVVQTRPRTWTPDEQREFKEQLTGSGARSIDDFLEDRNDLADLGKRFIAAALIPRETTTALHSRPPGHWLDLLWRAMKAPPNKFAENRVCLIVYNYDRCVEQFLTLAMAMTYKLSPTKAWDAVRQLTIIHPHGVLGGYVPSDDDQMLASESGRTFHQAVTPRSVDYAAEGISLYWENSPSQEKRRAEMHHFLAQAKRIVFLGFGFLDSNLDHLLPALGGNPDVVLSGTSLGLRGRDRNRMIQRFGPTRSLKLHDVGCHDFFADYLSVA